ncbi:MAG: NADH:flavin oxidoreductase/NADH oxidase family protein [Acidobacteriota bacterium]|nr:NADH:flavin oxidoreductase/NADH oxidase family protein [Acidobacteriota bacterium]
MKQPIAEPLTLPCGVVVPNRLAKAAMTEGLADARNYATPELARVYERWSLGGAGILLTGNVQIDRRYLERPGNVAVEPGTTDEERSRLQTWAEAGTRNGNQLWMQLSHAGRQTPALINKQPVAPSAIKLKMPGGQFGTPRALTEEEILDIVERFAHAASVAKETGFTGVQIHSAHGYLLSEFLSPRVNQRKDRWGGSLENRARLLLATVKRTREKVGPDFPIVVKLNSTDFQKGGFSSEECIQVVQWLGEAGLDLLEISGGNYEQPKMVGVEGLEPVFEEGERRSTRAREAYFMGYAARIREVATMPLMVTGGFRTREAMNAAIAEDGIAAVGLARPLCVLPDCPKSLLQGTMDQTPGWEKKLRIGPGLLGPNSAITLLKAVNAWGAQGWFCLQILRMGHGKDPNTRMSVLGSLVRYQKNEMRTAKAMKAART